MKETEVKSVVNCTNIFNNILAYGSLRRGLYNYKRYFGEDGKGANSLPPIKVKGFKLYTHDNINFPYAVFTGDNEDYIIAEPHQIQNNSGIEIGLLEMEFGYVPFKVTLDNIQYIIYAIDYASNKTMLKESGYFEVEDGDWIGYLLVQDLK